MKLTVRLCLLLILRTLPEARCFDSLSRGVPSRDSHRPCLYIQKINVQSPKVTKNHLEKNEQSLENSGVWDQIKSKAASVFDSWPFDFAGRMSAKALSKEAKRAARWARSHGVFVPYAEASSNDSIFLISSRDILLCNYSSFWSTYCNIFFNSTLNFEMSDNIGFVDEQEGKEALADVRKDSTDTNW